MLIVDKFVMNDISGGRMHFVSPFVIKPSDYSSRCPAMTPDPPCVGVSM